MLYEPVPGGNSPRGHHVKHNHGGNASTLDEINHGSPVPSRRNNENYHSQVYSGSGYNNSA